MKKELAEIENSQNEAMTLPGPARYEEELKDYSKKEENELNDNSPYSHPEPSPDK